MKQISFLWMLIRLLTKISNAGIAVLNLDRNLQFYLDRNETLNMRLNVSKCFFFVLYLPSQDQWIFGFIRFSQNPKHRGNNYWKSYTEKRINSQNIFHLNFAPPQHNVKTCVNKSSHSKKFESNELSVWKVN